MFWLSLMVTGSSAAGCGLFIKNPEITVKNVELSSLSLAEFSLAVTLTVINRNLIGIKIKKITFSVFYQEGETWQYLTCGSQDDITISKGSCEVTIPVTVSNMKLMGALVTTLGKGEITLRVKGVSTLDILGFAPKIPFLHVTTIPLKLPGA